MAIIAITDGIVCTKKILRSAVMAPYAPAIATLARKNSAIFWLQLGLLIKKVQAKPVPKNPFNKPWFAARAVVLGNKSFGKLEKTFGPRCSHKNISKTQIYACINATNPIKICAVVIIQLIITVS